MEPPFIFILSVTNQGSQFSTFCKLLDYDQEGKIESD
jgi:hypothetical protein